MMDIHVRERQQIEQWVAESLSFGSFAASRAAVSTQIPALSDVCPKSFGMAVATVSGDLICAGDSDRPFSIQSLSKLFSLCALLERDPHAWDYVGWSPTRADFNSVAVLERDHGRPSNPFVNSGALVVTDRLMTLTGDAVQTTVDIIRDRSLGGSVGVDESVARSEMIADHRNSALAHILAEHNGLNNDIGPLLHQYCHQCSITASVSTLALAGLFLADRGHVATDALSPAAVKKVNAVLLTSGMYGAAGDIAYRVGMPAKSGIGGGILAIAPGLGSVCVWSPPLDTTGNSAGGVAALERFAELSGWSVF